MILVFLSFSLINNALINNALVIQEVGIGFSVAIIIDAFIVRTILVLSLMHVFGRRSWWLPKWLSGGGGDAAADGSAGGDDAAGGGGGSGYIEPSAIVALDSTGVQSGNGQVLITVGTSTSLTTSNATPTYGQSITYSATVSPSIASGTVQFAIDGTNVGSPQTVTNGVATLATSTMTAGSHSMTATFT